MNAENNYLEKDVLRNEFMTFLDHMPHNSTLCGLLVDRMMKNAKREDRPELLQLIFERYHCLPSYYSGAPSPRYKINIEISLMEEFKEKVNGKIMDFIHSALKADPVETKAVFYDKLYSYIFENKEFINMDQRAYVLYICCVSHLLPYYEIQTKDLKEIDPNRIINQEISIDNMMRANFILNNPMLTSFERVALLNKEIEATPVQSRDILIEHIISFYERKLKTERIIRELNVQVKSIKNQRLIPWGSCIYKPSRYRWGKRRFNFKRLKKRKK